MEAYPWHDDFHRTVTDGSVAVLEGVGLVRQETANLGLDIARRVRSTADKAGILIGIESLVEKNSNRCLSPQEAADLQGV
jgi:hypothetical protein